MMIQRATIVRAARRRPTPARHFVSVAPRSKVVQAFAGQLITIHPDDSRGPWIIQLPTVGVVNGTFAGVRASALSNTPVTIRSVGGFPIVDMLLGTIALQYTQPLRGNLMFYYSSTQAAWYVYEDFYPRRVEHWTADAITAVGTQSLTWKFVPQFMGHDPVVMTVDSAGLFTAVRPFNARLEIAGEWTFAMGAANSSAEFRVTPTFVNNSGRGRLDMRRIRQPFAHHNALSFVQSGSMPGSLQAYSGDSMEFVAQGIGADGSTVNLNSMDLFISMG
jgi:hypothetical protein